MSDLFRLYYTIDGEMFVKGPFSYHQAEVEMGALVGAQDAVIARVVDPCEMTWRYDTFDYDF
jgi:hypothetical protein